jgi:2-iminobutanoate/2-iminopropanoate deaminase
MPLNLDNPAVVAAPLGAYSHVVEVPPGAGLIFLSGQVPVDPDGYIGRTLAEQADQVYANIVALLAAKGCEPRSIIKLTTYLIEDDTEGAVRQARSRHLGDHRPASTMMYVRQLVDPAWKIEVEAIALAPERQADQCAVFAPAATGKHG